MQNNCQDILKTIEKNRAEHGYLKNNIREYKRYTNKAVKNKTADAVICKLEKNMAKWFLFKVPKFLRKCIKILNQHTELDSTFRQTYKAYLECFLATDLTEEQLRNAWSLLNVGFYYSFNHDLMRLNDDRFDIDDIKHTVDWHDIAITFDSPLHYQTFVEKNFNVFDYRFNSEIAKRCLEFERLENETKEAILSGQFTQVFNSAKMFHKMAANFVNFLDINLITSSYVCGYKKDLDIFVDELSNAITSGSSLKMKSKCFGDIMNQKSQVLKNAHMTKADAIKLTVDEFKSTMNVTDESRNMPLCPIFYDIAFNYVSYE